ncbi:dienelactone hydrolase family protein [Nocardioides sp. Kera G14]|uniref:dienelactone hydrolase family protein n=1 Tax=Nocardioides sp. Kera G14 TaxID=2884264 RepID=UPI001D0FB42A|nr:dienelactone hydrolase family protein [Nocardioides sp. Kera G14]UDY24195.1 dienelactone hydrolase family protein [Nocardioides sp. Kera G14]
MAEIVLFHHSGGLTDGVLDLAEKLRIVGHTVHTPDLFEGRTFGKVEEGVAYANEVGEETFADRASAFVDTLSTDELVYGGLSMGCARAAEQVLFRDGALAAFFLYGVADPAWWDKTWPADVPAEAHLTEEDPWREPEAEEGFVKHIPKHDLFTYPGEGHLFLEPGHPDYDEELAHIVTSSIIDFLDEV